MATTWCLYRSLSIKPVVIQEVCVHYCSDFVFVFYKGRTFIWITTHKLQFYKRDKQQLLYVMDTVNGYCELSPCQNSATCVQDNDKVTCLCSPQYTGEFCESLKDLCDHGPCYNKGTCIQEADRVKCICTEHFLGTFCEAVRRYCLYENPCGNSAVCVDIHDGGYECFCSPGYYGSHCEMEIDECVSAPCVGTATCRDEVNGYTCICPPSKGGIHCEREVNEGCFSNPCKNGATCVDSGDTGPYSCICAPGFEGIYCEINIDDCVSAQCGLNQVCKDLINSHRCDCKDGWIGDSCDTLIDACISDPCQNSGSCVDEGDRYTCDCQEGYAGISCEIQVDACYPNPCHFEGTCVTNLSNASGFSCECKESFVGHRCEGKVMSCLSSPCQHGGSCTENINTPGFTCACTSDYTGTLCGVKKDGCLLTGCENGGSCTQISSVTVAVCVCSPGWTGITCDSDIDECELTPCYNDGNCINVQASYICVCNQYWTGQHCDQDMRQCNESVCMNNATCTEVPGRIAQCQCQQGKNCSEPVGVCGSLPCLHNGTCSETIPDQYHCECISGVHGIHCQIVTMVTLDGSTVIKLAPVTSFLTNGSQNAAKQERQSALSGNKTILMEVDIQFWFSTSILDGILIITHHLTEAGDVHFLVQLDDSRLKVSSNMYGETVTGSIKLPSNSQVMSHQVFITITTSYINVSLDHCDAGKMCKLTLQYEELGDRITLTGPIMIGGLQDVQDVTPYLRSKLKTLSPFVGCIGDLIMNDEVINLVDTDSMHSSVTAGCRAYDLCLVNMCENGGQCRDMWSTTYCQCMDGFMGSHCEFQQTAQFESLSFLHFSDIIKIRNISFWLSTNTSSGIIFYTFDYNMLCLYIDEGHLYIYLVVNGENYRNDIGNVTGGDWFQLSLQFDNRDYSVKVLHEETGTVQSARGSVGIPLNVQTPLYMGQLHEHPALDNWRNRPYFEYNSSFSGCVMNLTLNEELIDFQKASASVFGNDPLAAIPGCTRGKTCSVFPCQHGGTCVQGWDKHTCHCKPSYTGSQCEHAQSVTLRGETSYIDIHLNTSLVPFGDSGMFEFRTRDHTATLMYLQFFSADQDNASLEFSLYKTQLHVTLSSTHITRLAFDVSVSDGNWHTVEWQRLHDKLTVTFQSTTSSMAVHFNPFIYQPVVRVFLGGKPYQPDNPSLMIGLTKGCFRNVSFNNNVINILEDLQYDSGLVILRKDILTSCVGDNVCMKGACPENADCEDIWNKKICSCQRGWQGNICNVSADDCVDHVCVNGECEDGHNNYTCLCTDGYTGDFCEVIYDPCEIQPCFHNGTVNCTLKFPNMFECLCRPGWSGISCSEEINECESGPCLNNAVCVDLVDNFECKCTSNTSGRRCENIHICSSFPCFNGGTCVPTSDNTEFSCQCMEGYLGKQCQTYNFCHQNMCQNNASCVYNSSGFMCNCLSQNYGAYCQFTDYCVGEPCLNNGVCHSDVTTFRCACTELFSGKTCDIPVNRCELNMCKNEGTCLFNTSEPTKGYICKCVEGFTGFHCETDIDECQSNPCRNGATCIESKQLQLKFFPGYYCQCLDGYYAENCQFETNECESLPCYNNGTCTDLVGSFECACPDGFIGENCELDKRGCTSKPCYNNGVCNEDGEGYTCTCGQGYKGKYCQIDIDDCVNSLCKNSAICLDGINSYTCQCLPGYTGDSCENIVDACYSQPCMNNGSCLYRGLCNCSDVIQSCGWRNETCQTEMCSEIDNCFIYPTAYVCDCARTGFRGETCDLDVNECEINTVCEHGGICTNTAGSYTCDCKQTGYVGSRCEQDIDECSGPNPCYNGGECKNLFGSFQCLCGAGWTGETCGTLIDRCLANPCHNGGSCINTRSGYFCNCASTGYSGDLCEININDCIGSPCLNNGHCIDGVNKFTCDCTGTGYQGDSCEIERDACSTLSCLNNGSCTNTGLTFTCQCDKGYTGVTCSEDINECEIRTHRCTSGSRCLNNAGSYECLCSDEYTGEFCQIPVGKSNDSDSHTRGVVAASVIIIIIIIIFLILYMVWYLRKSRRMKGRYKPSQIEESNPTTVSDIHLSKIIDPTTGERLI